MLESIVVLLVLRLLRQILDISSGLRYTVCGLPAGGCRQGKSEQSTHHHSQLSSP